MTERTTYPGRRPGGDLDRYEWSNMFARPPVSWPGKARLALWVVVNLEWFRFDHQDVAVTPFGGPALEHPDFCDYSHRDYGNRVGAVRLMKILERHGIRVTAPTNAAVAERYPALLERAVQLDWSIIGHGASSTDLIHDNMDEAHESALVADSLAALRAASGQPVRGWLSPGMSESTRTLDILAENGVDYVCDWVNDDLPYQMRVAEGELWAMPYTLELSDVHVCAQLHQTGAEFAEQILGACDTLLDEAERHGGRTMCIALHPWVSGAPHRAKHLDRALQEIASREGVWNATGDDILAAFRSGA